MTEVAVPELMRTLAHELRQPLSTIESIAYYLTLILPQDEKTTEQLGRIQMLVEQSNWMLTSAQLLTDPIQIERRPVDLRELASSIEAIDATDAGTVEGDAALLRTALENLAMLYRQFPSPGAFRLANGSIEMEARGMVYAGAALSLQGVRRVIEAHGGTFDLALDPATGMKLRVMLT